MKKNIDLNIDEMNLILYGLFLSKDNVDNSLLGDINKLIDKIDKADYIK